MKEEESLTADHLLAEPRGRVTPKTIDTAPLAPCWALRVRMGLGEQSNEDFNLQPLEALSVLLTGTALCVVVMPPTHSPTTQLLQPGAI